MHSLFPSHTVGLELLHPYPLSLHLCLSPSHTVGLEHKNYSQALSQMRWSPSHTVGLEPIILSHLQYCKMVSIPHGGLRTHHNISEKSQQARTRSPSHTVGLEPQITTLNKIRHINHFVKGAPFSNEVNFPKSEIMQS